MERNPTDTRGDPGEQAPVVRRWECRCQQPPILLATYDPQGRVNIKSRDRYWHVQGVVRSTCPRCGREHLLDLGRKVTDPVDPLP